MLHKRIIPKILIVLLLINMITTFNISTSYAAVPVTIGSLPIGSIVYDPTWTWEFKTGKGYTGSGIMKPVEWKIVAKNHIGYPNNSVTLLSNELIGLHAYDNSTNRGFDLGNNHWGNSGSPDASKGIRKFLNCDVYNGNDRNVYAKTFYNSFSEKFKQNVLTTSLINADHNGGLYTTFDKVFIPSQTELGGGDLSTYGIGSDWGYFISDGSRIAKLGEINEFYYTRSPYKGTFAIQRLNAAGQFNYGQPFNEYVGIRPTLNIKSDALVRAIGGNKYEITYNTAPNLALSQPIVNQRTGNQDNLIINGNVKDENAGDALAVKYSLGSSGNSNITLTQPKSIISNEQWQSFQGYINLNGLNTGNNVLKLWVEDNKGSKSNIVEVPIVVFNTLENILNSLKSYVYKDEVQFLVINSNTTITQSLENDSLIEEIKKELKAKNVLIYFIGKDGETRNYIKSRLFLD